MLFSTCRFRRLALFGAWPVGLLVLAACSGTLDEEPGDTPRRSAQAVTIEAKAACSFHYGTAAMTGAPPATGTGFYGTSYLFADVTGDGNSDLVKSTAVDTVTVEKGNGNGTFIAAGSLKLPAPPNGYVYVGLGLVARGDFDGDGKGDVVALSTTALAQYPNASWWGHFVFLHGTAGGGLELGAQTGNVMTSGEGTNIHIAKDFDGDGKDDFIYGNSPGQKIVFTNASRTISAATSVGISGSIAIVDGPSSAALLGISGTVANKISWSSARVKSTATLVAPSLSTAAFTSTFSGDLDGDGNMERFGRGDSNTDAPSIVAGTIGATSATKSKFYGFDTYADVVGAFDLDADGKAEILYKDAGALYAACGYVPSGADLVATPLGPMIGANNTLLGVGDLNGDGRPDFVELHLGSFLNAYLSGPKPANAAPLVTLSSTPPTKDAGPSGKTDAGPKKKDAGSDAGKGSAEDSTGDGDVASGEDGDVDAAPSDDSGAPAAKDGGCSQSPRSSSSGASVLLGVGLGLAMLAARRSRGSRRPLR